VFNAASPAIDLDLTGSKYRMELRIHRGPVSGREAGIDGKLSWVPTDFLIREKQPDIPELGRHAGINMLKGKNPDSERGSQDRTKHQRSDMVPIVFYPTLVLNTRHKKQYGQRRLAIEPTMT